MQLLVLYQLVTAKAAVALGGAGVRKANGSPVGAARSLIAGRRTPPWSPTLALDSLDESVTHWDIRTSATAYSENDRPSGRLCLPALGNPP